MRKKKFQTHKNICVQKTFVFDFQITFLQVTAKSLYQQLSYYKMQFDVDYALRKYKQDGNSEWNFYESSQSFCTECFRNAEI